MNKLNVTAQNNLVSLEGALRSNDAINFKPQLIKRIKASEKVFTVDISGVEQMDITGLNSLLIAKKFTNDSGKELKILAKEGNPIFELVHLTKFDKFIDIQLV